MSYMQPASARGSTAMARASDNEVLADFDPFRIVVTSSDLLAVQGYSACICGGPFNVGQAILRCSSLGCTSAYHDSCVRSLSGTGVLQSSALTSPYVACSGRWRCVDCRVAAMVPHCLVSLLGRPVLIKPRREPPATEVSISFMWAGAAIGSGTSLMLACVPLGHGLSGFSSVASTDGADVTCVWPPSVTFRVNGGQGQTPAPPPADSASAPLMDITLAVPQNRTSYVSVSCGAIYTSYPTFAVAVLRATPCHARERTSHIVTLRCLRPTLAYAAVRASFEVVRRGVWRGLKDSDRIDLARISRRNWDGASAWASTYVHRSPFVPSDAGSVANAGASSSSSAAVATINCIVPAHAGASDAEPMLELETVIPLRDPLSFGPLRIPSRGAYCTHVACFDLETYLQSNMNSTSRPRAKLWLCPLCNTRTLPSDLFVDSLAAGLLKALSNRASAGKFEDMDVSTAAFEPARDTPKLAKGPLRLQLQRGYDIPSSAADAGVRMVFSAAGSAGIGTRVGTSAGSGSQRSSRSVSSAQQAAPEEVGTRWALNSSRTLEQLWADDTEDANVSGFDSDDGDTSSPPVHRAEAGASLSASLAGIINAQASSGVSAGVSSAGHGQKFLGMSMRHAPAPAPAYEPRIPSPEVIVLDDNGNSIYANPTYNGSLKRPASAMSFALPRPPAGAQYRSVGTIDLTDDPDDPEARAKRRKAAGYIPLVHHVSFR